MNESRIRALLGVGLGIALSGFALLVSCAGPGPRAKPSMTGDTKARITLDGDVSDWPEMDAALADDEMFFVRFMVGEPLFTLQASGKSVVIALDVDGDAKTGQGRTDEAFAGLGIDLEIVFSPGKDAGGNQQGAMLFALDSNGARTRISSAGFDLLSAPTIASEWFEVRLTRLPTDPGPLPRVGLLSQGTVRGVMALRDAKGAIEAWSDPFEALCPPVRAARRVTDLVPPPKGEKGLRVVSYNVHQSSPLKDAARFQRIFEWLDPDVILVQEWDEGSREQMIGWFTAMLPGERSWNVVKAPGSMRESGGVAIVTRLPIADLTDAALAPGGHEAVKVRAAIGKILSPVGEFACASVHLKCCGSAGSSEDQQRVAQAAGVNAAMRRVGGPIVIGGDMNLVGSGLPLEALAKGLDIDATDLGVADAWTIGDEAMTTWRDAGTVFTPGRLDYVLYSDARWKVRRSFVFDTSRMSESLLARLGLDADDTARASDHLPVVVDLERR